MEANDIHKILLDKADNNGMRILFIEADKWLDDHQEQFAFKLKNYGNDVQMVCDCYNKPCMIKELLTDWKPDVIFIQTTFVYIDKIKSMIPLVNFVTYPVELWYAGNYSASRIIEMLPEDKQPLFTGFDIWIDEFFESGMEDWAKKKI